MRDNAERSLPKMKHVLMYLNIPWDFIKQRPQFMAQKLSDQLDLLVYYNKPYKNAYLVKDRKVDKNINLVAMPKIPRKNIFLQKVDNTLQIFLMKNYLKRYEYIWIMHPDQYEILKNNLKGKKVLYDCMDDYSQFPHLSQNQKSKIQSIEQDLVKRADCIFYTSQTLQDIHKTRYAIESNTHVVNNAFEPIKNIGEDDAIKDYMSKIEGKKLVYIGAIAEWFDIQLVEKTLQENKEISIVLFGPLEIKLPNMERLYHFGKIPHSSIYTAMKYADALIMPFCINELILAVDPIKVYEYIYSGRQVIVPSYPEMDKFKDFVSIYKNADEFIEFTKILNIESNQDCLESFVQQNNWDARATQVVDIINKSI